VAFALSAMGMEGQRPFQAKNMIKKNKEEIISRGKVKNAGTQAPEEGSPTNIRCKAPHLIKIIHMAQDVQDGTRTRTGARKP
jgi:hypothetical protein